MTTQTTTMLAGETVGMVKAMVGGAAATDSTGMVRILQVGHLLSKNDLIHAVNGSIHIAFKNGGTVMLYKGENLHLSESLLTKAEGREPQEEDVTQEMAAPHYGAEGNVLLNDSVDMRGKLTVSSVFVEGRAYDFGARESLTIQTTDGQIIFNKDGAYQYVGESPLLDLIYTIKSIFGDTDAVNLHICSEVISGTAADDDLNSTNRNGVVIQCLEGNDALSNGSDVLYGDKGSDIFVFSADAREDKIAGDLIGDFHVGHVGIDLETDVLNLADLLKGVTKNNTISGGFLIFDAMMQNADSATIVKLSLDIDGGGVGKMPVLLAVIVMDGVGQLSGDTAQQARALFGQLVNNDQIKF